MVAEVLASMDIADVDFDGADLYARNRVAQRHARMRERAGVDDHTGCGRSVLVDVIKQVALVVGLERQHTESRAATSSPVGHIADDLIESDGAIGARFTLAEQVEVRPVDEQDRWRLVGAEQSGGTAF